MAFFDELNKRISGLTQSAQKATDIARLQRQVNVKQDEFGVLFCEIGKLYYDCRQRGVQPAEAMDALCDKVDALAAEIAGLKLKLDDMREIRRCPSCGTVQNNTNRFCANCGTRLETPASEEEPAEAEPEDPSSAEEPQEEAENGVYINWPDASQQDEEPEESKEENAEDTSDEESGEDKAE